jgi:hypothetical protein
MNTRSVILVLALCAASAMALELKGSACEGQGGTCNDVRAATCSKSWQTKLCPGSSFVQCCKGTVAVNAAPPPVLNNPATPPTPVAVVTGPTFELFRNCYPQGDADSVKLTIGGNVNGAWITNTCAIRMSNTFNCVGGKGFPRFKIAKQPNNLSVTSKKLEHHIFRVKVLEKLIFDLNLFKKAPLIFKKKIGVERGVDKTPLLGLKGVIMFDTAGAWGDASGHFDLWDGQAMVESSHANPATTEKYFGLSVRVLLWQLP